MKCFNIIFLVVFILFLYSCKKEDFDPSRYDKLKYVATIYQKATELNATIDGEAWQAVGKAVVDSASIEISGQAAGKKIYFKIENFKIQTVFKINQGLDSATIKKSSSTATLTVGDPEASIVTITRLDTVNKQIEGTFELALENTSKEKTTATKGYFKIDYSEVFMKANFNGTQPWQADTVWTKIDSTKDPLVITMYGKNILSDTTISIAMILTQSSRTSFKETQLPTAKVSSSTKMLSNRTGGELKIITNNPNLKIITGTFYFQLATFDAVESGRFSVSY